MMGGAEGKYDEREGMISSSSTRRISVQTAHSSAHLLLFRTRYLARNEG